MQNQFIRPKLMIGLAVVLLVGGVLAGLAWFDGGRLLSFLPGMDRAQAEAVEVEQLVPATGSGLYGESLEDSSLQSGYGCSHDSEVENPEDW